MLDRMHTWANTFETCKDQFLKLENGISEVINAHFKTIHYLANKGEFCVAAISHVVNRLRGFLLGVRHY